MTTLFQDLRYSLRVLRKNPTFAAIAALTFALGIGANTTMFNIIYGVMLRQLPYPQPDRLVKLAEGSAKYVNATNVGYGTFADWESHIHSFSSMAALESWRPLFGESGNPELLRGMRVTHNFFKTLGISPVLGRDFLPEEDRPSSGRSVLLSYQLWQRRFGSDRSVIGRTVRLTDSSYTIIGVLPANFQLLLFNYYERQPEIYGPLAYDASVSGACRSCQHLQSFARLAPGATVAAARSELAAFQAELIRQYPADYPADAETLVTPFKTALTGKVQTALYMLFGAVGMVLLIACANIAGLLLARGIQRQREIAVRAALGAPRSRLVRQLLTESLVLGLIGGAIGTVMAIAATALLGRFGPQDIPRLGEAGMGAAGLWFGVGLSIVAAVLFGLLPAIQVGRSDLHETLKEGIRGSAGPKSHRIRDLLVAAELALALVLLVGSGLLIRSLGRLLNVNPGFDPHGVALMEVNAVGDRFDKTEVSVQYFRHVIENVEKIPGVDAVGAVSPAPISGDYDRRGFHIRDRRLANVTEAPDAERYAITPDYLTAMRIPVLAGRGFTDQDALDKAPVALIDQTCAREMWPNEDPIGKQIQLGGREEDKPWMTIVGVVGDVHQYTLDAAPTMEAYVPQAQQGDSSLTLMVRSNLPLATVSPELKEAVASVDRTQPLRTPALLEQRVSASVAERRFTLALLVAFAGLAFVLALVGVYGVMAFTVESRVREFGIRMALGARSNDVVTLMLRRSARLIGAGLAAGLIASFLTSQLLTSLLFEVRPTDLQAIIVSAVVLCCAGLLAAFMPARLASRVDPIAALRSE
ncbi:MAG TPA: ABC transporter permease [Blastocatellia bacterium]|nr:ABC transporter permease [Blastocatellia bacterium]